MKPFLFAVAMMAIACRAQPAAVRVDASVATTPDAAPAHAAASVEEATVPDAAAADGAVATGEEPLEGEAPDQDPRSQTVVIRLAVAPATRAVVMWGRKRLGEVTPGHMTLEIERPRASGPLDIVVRADGFLPHHARLFTDRDDKLSIRLVPPGAARGLFGYRSTPAASPAPAP
jgi:hypothetical protein